jgi:uncharacterized protein YdhG (YjbR/CyaY superfamily)
MAEKSDGLSADERAAVKARAQELRAEAKAGKSRSAGEKAIASAIADMTAGEKAIAEGLNAIVADVAPELMPKTWYGMPAYADDEGKVVVFFQPATKFKARYSTIGFDGAAQLDDGDVWAVSFAVTEFTPAVKKKFSELVARAAGH